MLYAHVIQNSLMQLYYRVLVIHPTGQWRGENVYVQWMINVLTFFPFRLKYVILEAKTESEEEYCSG